MTKRAVRSETKKGVAILEVLIALSIFLIAVTVFYRVYQTAALQTIESKYRVGAIKLANERMEHIRNVSYADIGVRGGSINGTLIHDEVVTVNGLLYRVILSALFIDDPADGLVTTTDPTHFEDYKRVKAVVLWGEGADTAISAADAATQQQYGRRRVELVSTFVPPGGLEGTATNGVLSVNVLQSDGTPIGGALVSIACPDCSGGAGVSEFLAADAQGNATFIVPPSATAVSTQENYEICVSHSGYERVCTQIPHSGATPPAPGSYDPQDTHVTVIQGQYTTETIIIDPLADFELAVRDPFCQQLSPAGPYTLTISGGRVIGSISDTVSSEDIYALDAFFGNTSHTTDSSGEVTIYTDTDADGTIATDGSDAASHGRYVVDKADFEGRYSNLLFWKMIPSHDEAVETQVNAHTHNCNFIVVDRSVNGVFVRVMDESDPSNPIAVEGATVRAIDTVSAYSAIRATDKHGYAYFPEAYNTPMIAGDYDLTVEHADYVTGTDTVTISSGLEDVIISLTPTP